MSRLRSPRSRPPRCSSPPPSSTACSAPSRTRRRRCPAISATVRCYTARHPPVCTDRRCGPLGLCLATLCDAFTACYSFRSRCASRWRCSTTRRPSSSTLGDRRCCSARLNTLVRLMKIQYCSLNQFSTQDAMLCLKCYYYSSIGIKSLLMSTVDSANNHV